MLGNRAIYNDGWVACTIPVTLPWELSSAPPPDVITGYKWELYNVKEDPTEYNDLAAKMPEKLKQMQDSVLFRGEEVQRSAARQLNARALEHAASGPDSWTNGLHLFGRTDQRAG